MADLGNQKIKDTYQLVLQTDASGNLQNLTGGTPSPMTINSLLGVTGGIDMTNGTYLKVGGNNIAYMQTTQAHFVKDIRINDAAKTLYGTDGDMPLYHTGTHGYIDNNKGSLYITSSAITIGDATSEITVSDNLTVNDSLGVNNNLTVGAKLSVDNSLLYADKNTETVGVGTINPPYRFTVSGASSWTVFVMPVDSFFNLSNGSNRMVANGTGLNTSSFDVGDKLKINNVDSENTSIVTIAEIPDSENITLDSNWTDGDYQAAPGTVYIESGTADKLLTVNDVSGNTKFQVSGSTVMSGSTDLFDLFSTSATLINGGTF